MTTREGQVTQPGQGTLRKKKERKKKELNKKIWDSDGAHMEQHTSTGLSHGVDSNLRAVIASTRTIIREPGTRDAK